MRILQLYLLLFLIFSCAKKQNEITPQLKVQVTEPTKPKGKIQLLLGAVYKIDGVYQDFVMYPDTILKPEFQKYITDNGDSVILSEFNYFIHKLVLFKSDGDSIPLKDSVFIVKNNSIIRNDIFNLTSIPEGDYVKATFYLGTLKTPDQVAFLKSKAPEFFNTIDQYDFFQFKGLYKNSDTALAYPNEPTRYWKKFNWSLSSSDNVQDHSSQKMYCPFFTPIVVKNEGIAPYLHIRVNMRASFGYADQNKSLIDIKAYSKERFTSLNSILYANIFSVDIKGASRMFVNDHIHPN